MKKYNKSNIPLAKELRTNMTPEERHLWYDYLRAYPIRFQRQKAIGNYIADFYCAKARLVIELDGSFHGTEENRENDRERTEYLESVGITVIRFTNTDVRKNFREVCLFIDECVRKSLPPS
ncbi:MAG: endonuclease domain-containing protein [Clostridia bacterium]|nr:endonuclease domain-containing protein [Clostridia bacterium]